MIIFGSVCFSCLACIERLASRVKELPFLALQDVIALEAFEHAVYGLQSLQRPLLPPRSYTILQFSDQILHLFRGRR